MNINDFFRLTQVAVLSVLLAACNDDAAAPPASTPTMTAEKMQLISMSLQELERTGNIPSEGRLVIDDQTAMSEQVENFTGSDESLSVASALDSIFPYDFLPWSMEESDLAFVSYYQENLEPVALTLEDLNVLERDISLVMREQFKEYVAEDPWAGWEAFYADYPDAVGYMRLGNPVIFDTDGFALVHVDFICGAFCGLGYYALFRKENGEWKFETWYADWVS